MKKIRLWWHLNSGKPNFGDILNPYLVEKISGRKPIWTDVKRLSLFKTYIVVGSVISIANWTCEVWGAGIISKDAKIKKSKFLAVRGPESGKRLTELGFKDPGIYGDPALLLPKFYQPKVEEKVKIGIVPHYVDYDKVVSWGLRDDFKIINLSTDNPEEVIDQIASCDYIISSSLHGVIVAHAYGIKALWVEFSNDLYGDGIKFIDYFKSVDIKVYKPLRFDQEVPAIDEIIKTIESMAESNIIKGDLEEISKRLLSVCPFK